MEVKNCEIEALEEKLKLVLDFVQRVKLSGAPLSRDSAYNFKRVIDEEFNTFENKFVEKQCEMVDSMMKVIPS